MYAGDNLPVGVDTGQAALRTAEISDSTYVTESVSLSLIALRTRGCSARGEKARRLQDAHISHVGLFFQKPGRLSPTVAPN